MLQLVFLPLSLLFNLSPFYFSFPPLSLSLSLSLSLHGLRRSPLWIFPPLVVAVLSVFPLCQHHHQIVHELKQSSDWFSNSGNPMMAIRWKRTGTCKKKNGIPRSHKCYTLCLLQTMYSNFVRFDHNS